MWLRAETYGKPKADTRAPLSPDQARMLVASGHQVFVEKADHRVFANYEYEKAGCTMVEPGSWYNAPPEAFILGIKYLPKQERLDQQFPLPHKHIYFAHGWNGDEDGARIISRLEERNLQGKNPTPFYDLEDLTDHNGKRVAAFGYYAGYAGALLSLHVWCMKENGQPPPFHSLDPAIGREAMVQQVRSELVDIKEKTGKDPKALIIAPNGRCGKGAVGLLKELGITYTPWTREHTRHSESFPEILKHDVLLNCISFDPDNPEFISKADLKKDMKLSVIGDISCYPGPYNPINIYDDVTSYTNLTHTVQTKSGTLDIMAIENLPRLLAREASEEYSQLLFPHLKAVLNAADKGNVPVIWKRADDKSYKILSGASGIKELGMSISSHCFPHGYLLDEEKADGLLAQWLQRNPLSITDRTGFHRYIADGSRQVFKLRNEGEDADTRLKLSSLEEWSYAVDLKTMCADPHMIAHHSLETKADHFLRSTAGKMVMKSPALRKAYMRMLDEGHKALNGDTQAAPVMDGIISIMAASMSNAPQESQLIAEGFTSIRKLSSPEQVSGRQFA